MPVPEYLKSISYSETQNKNKTVFKVKCQCGCIHFDIYHSFLTKQERKECQPYYDALVKSLKSEFGSTCTIDENGTVHHWVLLSPDPHGPKEEVYVPEPPACSSVEVIKIKCNACGKEYIVFDSRCNGYDGMFNEQENSAIREYVPHFKLKKHRDSLPVEICICVEHDIDLDSFKESTGIDCSFEEYSNAYTWITIYELDHVGKKRRIFDCETA